VKLGLVMGGGGIVGIAWETGVLAALHDDCGFDPRRATVIMGSSAGSVTGAQAALGRDLDELVAIQQRPARGAGGHQPILDLTSGPQAEIMRLMTAGSGQEQAVRIGELAMRVETFLSEDAFVDSFRSMIASDRWPETDLRVTSCDCTSGEGVIWSADSGIDLVRAVASSCAIPGFFPTVGFNGRRYMDGPRGQGYTAKVLSEAGVDTALFIGPLAALAQFSSMMEAELELVRAAGIELHTVTGGPELAAIAPNLMDISVRAAGVDVGLADGRAAVKEMDWLASI
jgi:NTE family protein